MNIYLYFKNKKLIKEDGQNYNTIYFYRDIKNLVKNGKTFNNMLQQEIECKLEVMHKNIFRKLIKKI